MKAYYKKQIFSLVTVFILFVPSNLWSQISSNSGPGFWSDPSSWVGNIVPSANDEVTIVSGASIYVDFDLIHNATIHIEGTADFSIYNSGSPVGSLTLNNGDIVVDPLGSVIFYGQPISINNGHLNNRGQFSCGDFYLMSPSSGIQNLNAINIYIDGFATIEGTSSFTNNSSFSVLQDLTIGSGIDFINTSGVIIDSNLYNNGTFTSHEMTVNSIINTNSFETLLLLTVMGSIFNSSTGSFIVSPSFISGGPAMDVIGTVNNQGSVTITDTVNLFSDVNNAGTIAINNGFINSFGMVFDNSGTLEINGGQLEEYEDLINSGTITGSANGWIQIYGQSENTSTGFINGNIDVCDLSLVPNTYLDIDNGAANIDFTTVTFCSLVIGIDEDHKSSSEIFPIPTQDQFTLKTAQSGVLALIDITGNIISESVFDNGKTVISVENLSAGTYFVHLEFSNGSVEEVKLIKL